MAHLYGKKENYGRKLAHNVLFHLVNRLHMYYSITENSNV